MQWRRIILWIYLVFVLLFLTFLLTLALLFVDFVIRPYIHETGHIVFGSLGCVLKGGSPSFEITNWMSFLGVPYPQQTGMQCNIWTLFRFGGILFSLLVLIGIILLLIKTTRISKLGLYILILAFISSEGYNLICGTDNWLGNPLSICTSTFKTVYGWSNEGLFFTASFLIIWQYLQLYKGFEIGLQFKKKLHKGYEFA